MTISAKLRNLPARNQKPMGLEQIVQLAETMVEFHESPAGCR
jgi:hypothetical protein